MVNPNLAHLWAVAHKPERRIIGLMSGTSLDGLDVALCRVRGAGLDVSVEVDFFQTMPYSMAQKRAIRAVFAQKKVDFEALTHLNVALAHWHAEAVLSALSGWNVPPSAVDVLASHGQTVFHAPQRGGQGWHSTLQIGDGDHLAHLTGILTVSDFRQKHVAAGGEGAPLAVYGDYWLLSKRGENRVLLNIGGIANFTFLPASGVAAEVFVTDTGPGNTLMDAFTRHFFSTKNYDEGGQLAAQGHILSPLLSALCDDPFFQNPLPLSTGPEYFSEAFVWEKIKALGLEAANPCDILATLTAFSAKTIAWAFEKWALKSGIPASDWVVYVSGGGAHNPELMRQLALFFPTPQYQSTAALGLDPDAKEAVLFALLANETIVGQPLDLGLPPISMGKISFPH